MTDITQTNATNLPWPFEPPQPPRLLWKRGLCAALLAAFLGALIAQLGLDIPLLWDWYNDHITFWDWIKKEFDTADLLRCLFSCLYNEQHLWPVLGCASIAAATAWTTFAPRGQFRFTPTLLIIVATSIPLWYLFFLNDPVRKGQPMMDSWIALRLIAAPLIPAAILTHLRVSQPLPPSTPHKHPQPDTKSP